MSLAYVYERSYRSIVILCTDVGNIRERLPLAWDSGMSQISANEIPEEWRNALEKLEMLQTEFNRKSSPMWGNARVSVHYRHGHTLSKIAERMLSLHAMFEAILENEIQESKT